MGPARASTETRVVSDAPPTAGAAAPRVLVFTTLFPNPAQPRLGVFVRERVRAVAALCPTRVVAPILTRFRARQLDQGSTASVPRREEHAGLDVWHPRFATFPGVGRAADAALLFWQSLATLRQLYRERPFDLIDAHYAFPDGAAAVLLGKRFGVPVCVTLRGGDIDLLPKFRMRRQLIRRTLQRADRVFAVSDHLARGAAGLGLSPERVQVVPNGIDAGTFRPEARSVARQRLGIAAEGPLLVCVGNLLAEKGQHVLVEALALLGADGESVPHLVMIGGDQWGKQQYGRQIERRVQETGLTDRVQMLGSQPQDVLATWYNAADLVVLPTFREGCPNVVREALACGVPVVASRVGGVPELVTSDALGLLVEPGNARGLADALRAALRCRWEREAIAAAGGQRTWPAVAATVMEAFEALMPGRVSRERRAFLAPQHHV